MPLSPDDIENPDVRRAWIRGYGRESVDRLLKEIADSLEEALLERARVARHVERMEAEAASHKELEALLRSTLVSAERTAQDLKEQAQREADLIVREVHAQSRRDNRLATSERDRVENQVRKIRALLQSALEGLARPFEESATDGAAGSPDAPVDTTAEDEAQGAAR